MSRSVIALTLATLACGIGTNGAPVDPAQDLVRHDREAMRERGGQAEADDGV